jgi:hypothetical protein
MCATACPRSLLTNCPIGRVIVFVPFELQAHGMQSVVDYNNGKVAQVRCLRSLLSVLRGNLQLVTCAALIA